MKNKKKIGKPKGLLKKSLVISTSVPLLLGTALTPIAFNNGSFVKTVAFAETAADVPALVTKTVTGTSPNGKTYSVRSTLKSTYQLLELLDSSGTKVASISNTGKQMLTSVYWSGTSVYISGNSWNFTGTIWIGNSAYNYFPNPLNIATAPVAPTLSVSNSSATNHPVTVTIAYSYDTTTMQYQIGGTSGTWLTYSAPFAVSANTTVYARGSNTGGTSPISSIAIANIDTTPPAAATFSPSTTAATSGDVTVSITYPSDAATKEYKVGQTGTWTSYTAPVVMSANDTIFARSTDAVGNTSADTYLIVSNIDKVAPTTPTLVASTTAATNGNVTVSITYPSDASVKQYKIGSAGTWTTYTAAVTVTANDTVYARATDAAGNLSDEGTLEVTNIDKTAPVAATFSPSTTATTNGSVTVTITYPSDAASREYKIGTTGTWTAYTAAVMMTANDTLYARSTDIAGNTSAESTLVVSNIDKTAPTTPTLVASTTAATNGNVTVTITYPSDAAVKQYKIGSAGTWTTYTAAVTVTANDTVYARATDAAGNTSAEGTLAVTNIDKTAPVAATFSPSTTAATNGNVTVTITYPSDAASKEYKVGTAGTWTSYTAPVVMSANDTLYARSTDSVGNISVESNLVVSNIDKVAPTTPTLAVDKTTPTNGNVVVTITYPSDASVKQYKIGTTGTWTDYTAAVTITANDTVYARATDAAGNTSAEGTLAVTNIDKTAPIAATFSPSTTAPTNGNVTVTISYPGDSATKEYKVGTAGTWTSYTAPVVMSTNDTIYARSTDAVGNTSAESSVVISNIDKVAPTAPTLVASTTAVTNGNVTVTITYPSDATMKQYKVGSAGSWTVYTAAVTMSENDTIYARATDASGNVSPEGSLAVSNIDKTAPEAATLVASTTTPTNGNVTVTITYPSDASVKQYKIGTAGTWTSYTAPVVMSTNDTVYARSTDAVGNTSSESNLVVANIDNLAPITPTLAADKTTPTNANVTVTITYPGDAAMKQYKIGTAGTWTTYTAAVAMSANETIYARATDTAGNVSAESSLEIANIDKTAPTAPSIAVAGDQLTVTAGADSGSGVKETLVKLNTGDWTVYTSPIKLNDNNYTIQAKTVDLVGNESSVVSKTVTITVQAEAAATSAVVTAETSKTQAAVDAAQTKVDALTNGAVKDALQVRLDAVQAIIDAATALNQKISEATAAVVSSESAKTQTAVDAAQTKVDALPSGSVKDALLDRLDAVQAIIDAQVALDQKITEATTAVVTAETSKTQAAVDAAQTKVDTLPSGAVKDALQDRLDAAQAIIDAQVALDQKIAEATAAVVSSESAKTQTSVDAAQTKVDALPSGTVKDALQDRLDTVQAIIDAQVALDQKITEATNAVVTAETNKTQAAVDAAQTKVDTLPNGSVKDALQNRLNAVQTIIDAQVALNQKITEATAAVVSSESAKTQTSVDAAQTKVDALPSGAVKDALQDRLDVVQAIIDAATALNQKITDATAAVVAAESAKTQTSVDAAQTKVEALPNGSVKDTLQDRLDAVQAIVDAQTALNQKIAEATAAVVKAESSLKQVDLDAARIKVNALPEVAAKIDLIARLDALQVKIHFNSANDQVTEIEELPTPDAVNNAQDAVDKLPDGPVKDELQDRIDEVKNSAEYQISIIKDPVVKNLLNGVAEAVRKAEKYKTKTFIVAALDKLTAVPTTIKNDPLYSAIVVSLQTRADKCKNDYNALVAEQEFQTNLIKAQNAISYYEKYKTETYRIKAQDAINLLPDSKIEKSQLQAQLDALVASATYQDLVTKADIALTSYEKYRTTTYKNKAQDAINLMLSDTPEHAAKKEEMQARFDAVVLK